VSYLHVSDFKFGLDRRRKRVVGVPGTLWTLRNAHISRGGDIERAKKFVSTYTLPALTYGMAAVKNQLFVFGNTDLASSMPLGIQYQRLQHPSGAAMSRVLDAKGFDGKLYVIAEYADGNIGHFYNGTRVSDWDALADANSDLATLAEYLAAKIDQSDDVMASSFGETITVTAKVAGTAFTITKATADTAVNAVGSIDITAGTASAGTNKVSTITVDGNDILGAAVDWATSHAATATAVAAQITANTSSPNFTATADGATITITAAVTGNAANGDVVSGTVGGDVTIGNAVAMAGGNTNDQDITLTAEQANVAAVAEVRATGSVEITGGTFDAGVNKISSVTVDGVELLGVSVDWISSNNATATALAAEINNGTSTHEYTASAVSAVVTIKAAVGTGAAPNGFVVTSTVAGDVTKTDTNMASGVTAVTAVAQVHTALLSGTFDPQDVFTVTVNSIDYKATGRGAGMGTSLFVYKKRVWSTANSLLFYCKLNDASDWSDPGASSGAGFINMANDSEGTERLTGAASYEGKAAIFSRQTTRVYELAADATEINVIQPLENTGTIAPRSVVPYGNNDVFYLDTTGVRSLRARDASGSAYVADVGSAIDPFVRAEIDAVVEDTVARAVGVLEPTEGRYMLALGDLILSLSYFPGSKITAWSYYDPGFSVSDFAKARGRVYARGANKIYLYGGADNAAYPDADEQTILVELPFMAADTPATFKGGYSFDAALTNDWSIEVLVDPDDETKVVDIGVLNETTYHRSSIHLPARTPMVALKMTCSAAGNASFSSLAIHYKGEEAK
jgi:hypothetical protein